MIEKYLAKDDYRKALKMPEEIGAILWGILKKLK